MKEFKGIFGFKTINNNEQINNSKFKNKIKKIFIGISISLFVILGNINYSNAFSLDKIQKYKNYKFDKGIILIGENIEHKIDAIAKRLHNKHNILKYQKLKVTTYLLDQIDNLKHKINYQKYNKILNDLKYYLIYDYLYKDLQFKPIKVTYVVDGDTVKYKDLIDKKYYKLRMIGIDSPESYKTRFGYTECFGNESKEHLKKLVERGRYLFIELDKTQGLKDRYGRILGYLVSVNIYRCPGLCGYRVFNLNGQQIRDGYAFEYTYKKPYIYQDLFKTYEQIAKDKKKGLWSEKTCNGERKAINN